MRGQFSTHRPKLIMREAYVNLTPQPGVWVTAFVCISNIGETAAHIIDSCIEFVIVEDQKYIKTPQADGRHDLNAKEPIQPGETHKFTVTSFAHKWDEKTLGHYSQHIKFFLAGHVVYADEIGIRRAMAFWRKYHRMKQRFEKIYLEENEYEYSN